MSVQVVGMENAVTELTVTIGRVGRSQYETYQYKWSGRKVPVWKMAVYCYNCVVYIEIPRHITFVAGLVFLRVYKGLIAYFTRTLRGGNTCFITTEDRQT